MIVFQHCDSDYTLICSFRRYNRLSSSSINKLGGQSHGVATSPFDANVVEAIIDKLRLLRRHVAEISVLVLHELRSVQPQTLRSWTECRVPKNQIGLATVSFWINREHDAVILKVLLLRFEHAKGSVLK